eukprot:1068658-Alexandrium_andersonii.AAC.1
MAPRRPAPTSSSWAGLSAWGRSTRTWVDWRALGLRPWMRTRNTEVLGARTPSRPSSSGSGRRCSVNSWPRPPASPHRTVRGG